MGFKIINNQPLGFAEKRGDEITAIGSGMIVGGHMGLHMGGPIGAVVGTALGAVSSPMIYKMNNKSFPRFCGWMSSIMLLGFISKYMNPEVFSKLSFKDTKEFLKSASKNINFKMLGAGIIFLSGTMVKALFAKEKPNGAAKPAIEAKQISFLERLTTEFPENLAKMRHPEQHPIRFMFLTQCVSRALIGMDGIDNLLSVDHASIAKGILKISLLGFAIPAGYSVIADTKDNTNEKKQIENSDKFLKKQTDKLHHYLKHQPEKLSMDVSSLSCVLIAAAGDTIVLAALIQNIRLRNIKSDNLGVGK